MWKHWILEEKKSNFEKKPDKLILFVKFVWINCLDILFDNYILIKPLKWYTNK